MKECPNINELPQLFSELSRLLTNEGEDNWVRGINLILSALTPPNYCGSGDPGEAIEYVENTYRKMVSGNGSFSDFFIRCDDADDRNEANKKLDRLRADIWSLINA
ncbi:hypothetical protein [Marinobacter sp. V034]|uniref:hypothetical protein n=1 Tax=Marinobacter sp. V034 TaxID=3459610 RepID=UPI004044E9E8